ncbi:MAG: hypothetical protein M3N02_09965 [Pseudomonadota bacterium]|nr:hypothetical protein [Pseudomonadota bacterium]
MARLAADTLPWEPIVELGPDFGVRQPHSKRETQRNKGAAAETRARFRHVATAAKVRRAAQEGARVTFAEKDGAPSVRVMRLSPVLAGWRRHGGVIMAAGAHPEVLRAIRPDVEIVTLNVADGCQGIERVHVVTSDVATSKLDTGRLRRICQDVMRRAAGRKVLIICAKTFVDQVRQNAPAAEVTNYGAARGRNDWNDFDVYATIGDHFENKLSIEDEAELLGINAGRLWTVKVATELEQAHGRARDPRRTRGALHLHFGSVRPGRWTVANTTVETWRDASEAVDRKGDDEELIRLHREGRSYDEIATIVGLKARRVRDRLTECYAKVIVSMGNGA